MNRRVTRIIKGKIRIKVIWQVPGCLFLVYMIALLWSTVIYVHTLLLTSVARPTNPCLNHEMRLNKADTAEKRAMKHTQHRKAAHIIVPALK